MAEPMMPPDLLGCPEHGRAEMVDHPNRRDGANRWYCLACRRQRESRRHYNGERCYKRGHLKTPWSWRFQGGCWRCVACVRDRHRERRAVSQASTQTEDAA